MQRFTMTCGVLILLATFSMMLPCEASAQKKKAPPPPKTEQAIDQPAPVQTKLGTTLKDILAKYKGQKTNLGILSKGEGDYFVVEDDGVSTFHPLSAIAGIKVLKVEEGEEDAAKIDITLMR